MIILCSWDIPYLNFCSTRGNFFEIWKWKSIWSCSRIPKNSSFQWYLRVVVEFEHLQKISSYLLRIFVKIWLWKNVRFFSEAPTFPPIEKKSIFSIRGENLKISLFLNSLWDERGRCNLINDPINTVVLLLFLEISFFKVRLKISLDMEQKTGEKFSTFWSFSISCHSTQMNVNRMIVCFIRIDSSYFLRHFGF